MGHMWLYPLYKQMFSCNTLLNPTVYVSDPLRILRYIIIVIISLPFQHVFIYVFFVYEIW